MITGGPMMGLAQPTTDLPVIKGTSGIVALTSEDAAFYENGSCIRCAACVGPVRLTWCLLSSPRRPSTDFMTGPKSCMPPIV